MMKKQGKVKVSLPMTISASRFLLAVLIIGILLITKSSHGLSALWNNLGSVYLNQALFSSANAQFTKAGLAFHKSLANDSENGYTYYNLGNIYTHFGDMVSAHDVLSRAVDALPEDAVSLFQLGFVKSNMQDAEGAIASWQQAGAAPYFTKNSQELTNEGDLERAFQDAQRAITIDPTFGPAYIVLGEIYNKQKDYANALQVYHIAVSLEPESVEGLYRVALMYEQLEQPGKAINYYYRALIQQPPYIPALDKLVKVYTKESQCVKAEAVLYDALTPKGITPSSANALRIISKCYVQTQELDAALPNLEKLASLETAKSDDFILLAQVYEGLDRKLDAINIYQYIALIDPDNEEVLEGLRRLKREEH